MSVLFSKLCLICVGLCCACIVQEFGWIHRVGEHLLWPSHSAISLYTWAPFIAPFEHLATSQITGGCCLGKKKSTHLVSEVLRVKTKLTDPKAHGLTSRGRTSHPEESLYFLFPSKRSQSHLASMTICHS